MLLRLFFLFLSTYLNEPSFLVFKNYHNNVKINNFRLRESGNLFSNSALFGINLDKGNYQFSPSPLKIYPNQAQCVQNKLLDKVYSKNINYPLKNLSIDIKSDNTIIIVSLNYVLKCSSLNYPYFYLEMNNKQIYGETTPIAMFYESLILSKGKYLFKFGLKIGNNTKCFHGPTSKNGYIMGYHFCILENNQNTKKTSPSNNKSNQELFFQQNNKLIDNLNKKDILTSRKLPQIIPF